MQKVALITGAGGLLGPKHAEAILEYGGKVILTDWHEDKIIEKSGAWVNYGDMRLGQGRENAKQFLRDNPHLLEEISHKVMAKRIKVSATVPAPFEVSSKHETAPGKRAEPASAPSQKPLHLLQ